MRPAAKKDWDEETTDTSIDAQLMLACSPVSPKVKLTLVDVDEEHASIRIVATGGSKVSNVSVGGHAFVPAANVATMFWRGSVYAAMLAACLFFWYEIVKLVFSL